MVNSSNLNAEVTGATVDDGMVDGDDMISTSKDDIDSTAEGVVVETDSSEMLDIPRL